MIKKILIVDDSPIARRMLKSCIPDKNKYTIIEATNGQEALEQYSAEDPDIIFLDLTMPVMDGYEAMGELKNMNQDVFVIALTADVQQRSVDKIMGLGAYTLLKKPASTEDIAKVITEATDHLN